MSAPEILLPGETISVESIPWSANKQLKLGPGLQQPSPGTYKATTCGILQGDSKKRSVYVESNGGRYIPQTGDLVIATVHHSSADLYHCLITPHTPPASLPHLSFEGANRKTRPHLVNGSLVYARVANASKHADPELECVHPSTNKAEGLGPLKGGMTFDVSLGFARRLMAGKKGGIIILDELAQHAPFEAAVGKNGRVWINGGDNLKVTLGVGRALLEADEKGLTVTEQKKMIERILKGR